MAREWRHDVEQLQRAFGVSFEQVCNRLSITDCVQRAYPPADRRTIVDPDRREVVPYRF